MESITTKSGKQFILNAYLKSKETAFGEIYEIIVEKETSIIYVFSIIMITLGLFSKLAIFPFANWIIDVYKGSETSVLAFLFCRESMKKGLDNQELICYNICS